MLGLDYSSGPPSAQAVRDAGYDFVVRYCGTPGRAKNLTRAEAQDMAAHGVAVALVYEDRAGTALQGRTRGRADARSVLDDAAACGVQVRAAYFAVDFDVTDAAQQSAVDDYLTGAADILGAARVGVYGEYDVVEHCLSIGAARYGWQTMAWSHRQVSDRAHLLQRLGQVTVGGITCDVNEARQDDFGQWPAPTGDENDMTPEQAQQLADLHRHLIPAGIARGQTTVGGTIAATLGTVQRLYNVTNALPSQMSTAVGSAVEAAVAKLGLSGVDADALAREVVAELGAALSGAEGAA